ncbi:S-adenosyl-L-methionine-dependent methyltransferase [Panus rudis PR-1116 ss-1]|nr:S-adenosyl-L-methionine-dependent methyltransferase [Panus rudis PR-1116 ss-1]
MSCTIPTLNAHGQPGDTPNDRLAYLIHHLCLELDSMPVSVQETSPGLAKALALANEARRVVDGYDEYVARMSSPPHPIVEKMLKEGNERDWERLHKEGKTKFRLIPEMSAGGYEAVALSHLARMSKAERILEVGMFTGTTTVSLALAPWTKKITTVELEPYLARINRPYFQQAGVARKIDIKIGDAMEVLEELAEEGEKFDMIFIDADKPSYRQYLNICMSGCSDSGGWSSYQSLLAQGGMIVVDNTAYKGAPWAPDERYPQGKDIDAFNKHVREHGDIDAVMLPIEDGITLIRRRGEEPGDNDNVWER